MSSVVGGIEIQMAADLARLRRDMADAKTMVGGAATSLQGMANTVKAAFGAIGLGLSVAAFGNWIKSAINAADETFNLSQKVGIAAQDLAGLQLAFGQAGVGSAAMQTALVRLSKGVAEGNEAFARMGVSVRGADGSLKSSKQVLYDVADVFEGMPDGIRKTALATEVFGKAGADLIPMLNGGSEGLEAMADMAEKLGLVIDDKTAKAADEFNDTIDLLGKGTQGVAMQVAAQLLPTLTNLAGAFLTSMTSGNRLANVAAVLSTVLKTLYSVAVGVVGYITALGQSLGGLAAATVMLARGEFAQAAATMRSTYTDAGDTIKATAAEIAKAWDDTGGEGVQAAVQMGQASDRMVVSTREQEAAIKAAAAEAKRAADAAQRNTEAVLKAQAEQEKWRKEWFEEEAKRDLQRIAQYEATQQAEDARVASAAKMVQAIRLETEQLGMSNEEREISVALLKLEEAGIVKGSYAYEVYAEKIRAAIVDRNAVKASIDQARAISDEWQKSADAITSSLSDALFRAFESGKGFADAFKSTLINAFKSMVLQPTIKAITAPISGALGSMFSGGAAAAGAGGSGGAGMLGSLLGGVGFAGSMFGTGAAATMSGTGLGALLGGAGGMIGNGSIMGGLGLGLGAVAPYALAAYALYSAFKHKKTPHMGSAVNIGADGSGSTLWGDGSGFTRSFSGETDAALRGLGGVSVGGLNSLAAAFGGAADFGGQARFAADGKDASIGQFQLTRGGRSAGGVGLRPGGQQYGTDGAAAFQAFTADVARATRQAVDMIGLPQWAREQFEALGSEATLEQFAALADSVAKFQNGLTGMQQAVSQLGGVFARVAGLGGDALEQLVDFAGGLEQLGQKTQGYVQNYYSRDEIAGLKAREIRDQLSAVGITTDITGNDPRGQFRALVDSVDVGSEAGRKQLATLLGAADSFTSVADYLTETGGTLSGAAASAPALGALGSLFASGATQQVAAINSVEQAVNRVTEAVMRIQPSIGGNRGNSAPAAGWEVTTGGQWDDRP